tara:strand:- start:20 stop:289 length:270 start_codon:yes stop_codon:yes gene_type:complete
MLKMSKDCVLWKFSLFLCMFFLVASVSSAQVQGAWTETFLLDCHGNVNFAESHLFAVRGNIESFLDFLQFLAGMGTNPFLQSTDLHPMH